MYTYLITYFNKLDEIRTGLRSTLALRIASLPTGPSTIFINT